jgi:hypothetical protein
VCGCDNVTYWNDTVAASRFGMSVKASGQCAGAAACTANGANKCQGDLSCNLSIQSAIQCGAIGNAVGTCWGLPSNCVTPNGKLTACGGPKCTGACEAIRAEKPFYSDITCGN